MEGLGKRLQEARIARNLTLDEAARMTKVRPSHLAELEAEDFSHFASLAYAKGFLQIYGKFLNVDVSSYLEMFETSEQMTVDGYSYLQDNPAPKPRRTHVVRKPSSNSGPKTPVMPLVIGFVALVIGFFVLKLMLDIHRLAPQSQAGPPETIPTPGNIVAPRALPVGTPLAQATTAAPSATPVSKPVVAAATPVASAASNQPEVRRAELVHPEDLAQAGAAPSPGAEAAGPTKIDIRPLKKTYIKVVVNNDDQNPALEQWISPSEGALHFEGQRIAIRVLDREAVQIKKNGKIVSNGDADLRIE
jgi:cytoskeleton protein RodZ